MRPKREMRDWIAVLWLMGALLAGCRVPYHVPEWGPPVDLPPYVWQPLLRTFQKRANGLTVPEHLRLFREYLAKPDIPVRVAVIDVAASPHMMADRSSHVHSVTGIISSLICPVGVSDCSDRVGAVPLRPREAVDARSDSVSLSFEQFHGALSSVLAGYQVGKEHLVIYVAVGWDPIKIDDNDRRVNAIIELLRLASCKGAIVIAPAGNTTGTMGPMIPAAFESVAAPTNDQCVALGAPRPALGTPRGAAVREASSLAYAVGGLDANDRRLLTDRPWALPRLAAYGLSVTAPVAPGANQLLYTVPLSGTSGPGAIVSAAAAAVWSAQPKLDAQQVMALVYEGGEPIDGIASSYPARTEFCLGQPFGPCTNVPVHRVSLCGALKKALPAEKITCSQGPLTAADFPQYPPGQEPKNLGPPPPPCRVSGCGVPRGPSAAQIPDGLVSQPPIPTCPGCLVNMQFSALDVTLRWDTLPGVMRDGSVTFSDLYFNTVSVSSVSMAGSPTAHVTSSVSVPATAFGAVLTVNYLDANGNAASQDLPLVLSIPP
jgi:hypothetical protein